MKNQNVGRLGIGVSLLTALCATNALAAPASSEQIPLSLQFHYAPAEIDGGEKLGLLSTSMLFELNQSWWAGPSIVGAASGHRGGFFVLGGQIERRWNFSPEWQAQLSVLAGGGGGGAAPVGDGLMIEPTASILYNWGPIQSGLALSAVMVPDGKINSQQIGVIMNWNHDYRFFNASDVGKVSYDKDPTGLGLQRFSITLSELDPNASAHSTVQKIKLLGVRADHQMSPHTFWGLEAAAATHGGADGYMELLGTAGAETSLSIAGLESLKVGARAGLGLGGGGAVPTGGGTLAKVAGYARWDLGPYAFVGLEAGHVLAGSGGYNANYLQGQLGIQLDHPDLARPQRVQGAAWSASVQHVMNANRKAGPDQNLDTLGLKLRWSLDEYLYFTGQTHFAFTGNAGAYATGLMGMGIELPFSHSPWSFSAELLGGAAGGGGVDSNGGAVAQAMAYLGRNIGDGREIQLGIGQIKSRKGGLNSPIIDISWTQHYGTGIR